MAFDPSDYCSNPKRGGPADGCGCPADRNTQDLLCCPHCNGNWYRAQGSTSTTCLHPQCGRTGSVVVRPARYTPTHDADGNGRTGAEARR